METGILGLLFQKENTKNQKKKKKKKKKNNGDFPFFFFFFFFFLPRIFHSPKYLKVIMNNRFDFLAILSSN